MQLLCLKTKICELGSLVPQTDMASNWLKGLTPNIRLIQQQQQQQQNAELQNEN